jgi:TfoX/Sxy family transcriptional regulator of competence genes
MASDQHFAEFVRDQMSDAGDVSYRKMFGEYAVYLDGKVVALVCDNQCFVKATDAGRAYLGSVTEAPPFPGANPYFLIADELDDRERVAELVRITAGALPPPRKKKAAGKTSARKRK